MESPKEKTLNSLSPQKQQKEKAEQKKEQVKDARHSNLEKKRSTPEFLLIRACGEYGDYGDGCQYYYYKDYRAVSEGKDLTKLDWNNGMNEEFRIVTEEGECINGWRELKEENFVQFTTEHHCAILNMFDVPRMSDSLLK